ncbi:MAG: hypothetical protein ACLRQF_12845 [Thomasclavelia ramosa]
MQKVDGLNLQARYLKFEITRTKVGADKWVRFQELEINNGEFILHKIIQPLHL